MGSNTDRAAHLSAAREALRAEFPDIRFGEEMETEVVGSGFLSPFSNQLAVFSTVRSADEVRFFFKDLEHQAGRRPEHKAQGIVQLDIDLLKYDDTMLKPGDWERPYVRQGWIALSDKFL